DTGLREGRQLDLKEQLPTSSDKDKHEFLADVSSFANVAGGDLVFGVREKRDPQGNPTGEAESVPGLPGANLDKERLRLEQILLNGLDPRVIVRFHDILRGSDPPCLVVRVSRSWSGLHMILSTSRFYGRTSSGKYQLDVREIARGFLAGASARERFARF